MYDTYPTLIYSKAKRLLYHSQTGKLISQLSCCTHECTVVFQISFNKSSVAADGLLISLEEEDIIQFFCSYDHRKWSCGFFPFHLYRGLVFLARNNCLGSFPRWLASGRTCQHLGAGPNKTAPEVLRPSHDRSKASLIYGGDISDQTWSCSNTFGDQANAVSFAMLLKPFLTNFCGICQRVYKGSVYVWGVVIINPAEYIWQTYSGNQTQVLFCTLLKYSELCCDLVWHKSETPFSISSLTHWGCVWKTDRSTEQKAKLINLWKHTSLAKRPHQMGDERGTFVALGKACGIRSAPSGWARLHLSGPYGISAAATFHNVRNVIKCKCPLLVFDSCAHIHCSRQERDRFLFLGYSITEERTHSVPGLDQM